MSAKSPNHQIPRSPTGPSYWRSLDHLADTEEFREFLHREFPAGASEMLDSADRRHFLKIMGASMALAGLGLAGCRRWPKEEIVPFASRPEDRDPGIPVDYATSMELGGVAMGLLAKSFDGRPIKIEGNPEHPASNGATNLLAQASVLDLYDVDRSRSVRRGREGNQTESTFADFQSWASEHFRSLRSKRGRGLAILSEATSSPSALAMKRRLLEAMPESSWHEYEPINHDNEIAGSTLAFGVPHRSHLDLDKARIIVALDSDFLYTHPDSVRHMRGFAAARRADARRPESAGRTMARLYAFESELSLTGSNADERASVRSADVAIVAAYLVQQLVPEAGADLSPWVSSDAAKALLTDDLRQTLDHAIEDLKAARDASGAHSLIVAGSRQPAEVHYLAYLLNEALGNVGATVSYSPQREQVRSIDSIRALVDRDVDTLVILGGNPVFNAPADLNFATWLDGVANTIHLSDYNDETSVRCDWHLNRAHYLETWGDGRSWDGTYTMCQPLIRPLGGGRSPIELLAIIADDEEADGQAIVRRTFNEMTGSEDDRQWRRLLHDGLQSGSAYTMQQPKVDRGPLGGIVGTLRDRWTASLAGWEVVFGPHPAVYDGRFANNGWLQELPDPISKLTWDNAVLLSPQAATDLGLGASAKEANGAMVTVAVGDALVAAAVLVVPGVPDRTAVVHLGYGRGFDGRICADAGFNMYPLRRSDAMDIATNAEVTKANGTYKLACTQDHHAIDVNTTGGKGLQDRLPSLFREATLNTYRNDPTFAKHRTHVVHRLSIYEEQMPFHTTDGERDGPYAWGMSIDLNACTGCSACVVACQAENNIPIVGKEQVIRGREMHWIRIDRYFEFGVSERSDAGKALKWNPNRLQKVALQPVLCMHCENAPCETVCPVAATVHDSDGLNVMVYNRCIGTRYCSNNCPYKVRRFNYFDYHRRPPYREKGMLHVAPEYYTSPQATPDEFRQMQFNPEVSVRMRGVMEKCTFCVQRIADAKIKAKNRYANQTEAAKQRQKNERVGVPDGSITPACAQACPAEAIVFGDLKDRQSRVAKLHRHDRNYQMLEELNVKPRMQYLAKIRNPFGGGAVETGGHGHGGNGSHDEQDAHGEASDH